jgi:hypothetical protein
MVTLANDDGQGHDELLLVSFHATSGYNANENCQAYFDSFYDSDYRQRAIPLLWIVEATSTAMPGGALDTANIVTGSRTRRKSTKYNTGIVR